MIGLKETYIRVLSNRKNRKDEVLVIDSVSPVRSGGNLYKKVSYWSGRGRYSSIVGSECAVYEGMELSRAALDKMIVKV